MICKCLICLCTRESRVHKTSKTFTKVVVIKLLALH